MVAVGVGYTVMNNHRAGAEMSVVEITGDEERSGQTNSDVHIRPGGRLVQRGQLNGNATVDDGGELEQRGQLNGDLHAAGRAVVTGQVNGQIHVREGGEVLIAEGVQLGTGSARRVVNPDGTFGRVEQDRVSVSTVGSKYFRLGTDGRLSPA